MQRFPIILVLTVSVSLFAMLSSLPFPFYEMYFVPLLRNLYLRNTRSLSSFGMTGINGGERNTRFLAALEIEVGDRNGNSSSLASLRDDKVS